MVKKRIEIIDISLKVNVTEEIKSKVDSLSGEIIKHTKEAIKKSGMKIQRTNKRKLIKQANLEKTKLIVSFLEQAFETPGKWVDRKEILDLINVKDTPQNMNSWSLRIRRYLKDEDKWVLSKKRYPGQSKYRLTKFS